MGFLARVLGQTLAYDVNALSCVLAAEATCVSSDASQEPTVIRPILDRLRKRDRPARASARRTHRMHRVRSLLPDVEVNTKAGAYGS